MAIELAGAAAKVVETAKKVEKVVSKVEKPVKAVEKITADKAGNWGADIIKNDVKKEVSKIKGNLADKLKDYLSKADVNADAAEIEKEVIDKQNDTNETKNNIVESREEKITIKDRLNKYLDSSDSQSTENENMKDESIDNDTDKSVKDIDTNLDDEEKEPDGTQEDNQESDKSLDDDNINSNNDTTNEVNTREYNEDGTRELTNDEKQVPKEKLGWSDEKLKKCTIDKDGVIHYKTDRCDLEGKTSENGIPYERRQIVINGVVIEGVFPKFDSIYDTRLADDNLKTKTYAKECNAELKETIQNNPELRSKFITDQIKDIEEGRTPTGYVWHHNEEPGKMQLVKREDHDRAIGGAAHTGGNSLWGADSINNGKKGESF